MTDTLPEDAWLNSFLPTPPRPLQAALQKRLHASTTHVNSLAELYKQRAAVEAQYAESLSKLARSAEQGNLLPKAGIEWDRSSGEGKIWESVLGEIAETSTSHSTLAAMIRTDFEQPLRDVPNKIIAWRRIGEQDASLEKTLKEYEKTSVKLEKASSRSKSNKTEALSSELNQLTSSLSSLSPMVYTTYQRLDEERLRILKEVVVRWSTVRADMAQKNGERAERSVATLISWETSDEVLAIGRKLGSLGGAKGGTPNIPPLSSNPATPQSNRRLSSVTSTNNDFSPRPTPRQNGSTNLSSAAPSSFTGGIKSMLGRKPTLGAGARARSGSNATSVKSGRDKEGGAFTAIDEGDNNGAQSSAAPPVDEDGFSVAPANRHRNPWEEPTELEAAKPVGPSAAPPSANGVFAEPFSSSPVGSSDDLTSVHNQLQPRLNLAMTSAPIEVDEEERNAALQKMQQTLQMQPPQQPTRRGTIARGRRDVRNTIFVSPPDNFGSGSADPSGTSSSNPAAPSATFNLGSPLQSGETLRNGMSPQPWQLPRLPSLSSVTSNNPFDTPGLAKGPILPPTTVSTSGPGLRASMMETVNAVMTGGKVDWAQINGDIHFSLRLPPNSSSNQGPIHLQVTEFEHLTKIAPNPAYLAQVPDKPGEYILNPEVLAAATTTAPSNRILLFRYQVHIPVGQETSAVPIILEPVFKCVDGETKMILNYKSNPESSLAASRLNGVTLLAAFGAGPNVTNVQAKPPGGVWSAFSRSMAWKLNDTNLDGKVIARFTSEPGELMKPLNCQASWAVEDVLASDIGLKVILGDLEGGWTFEEIKKAVVAGKYMAEPVLN